MLLPEYHLTDVKFVFTHSMQLLCKKWHLMVFPQNKETTFATLWNTRLYWTIQIDSEFIEYIKVMIMEIMYILSVSQQHPALPIIMPDIIYLQAYYLSSLIILREIYIIFYSLSISHDAYNTTFSHNFQDNTMWLLSFPCIVWQYLWIPGYTVQPFTVRHIMDDISKREGAICLWLWVINFFCLPPLHTAKHASPLLTYARKKSAPPLWPFETNCPYPPK